ncbi:MAG: glycosyltransferase [Phycisphaerae bacterium]
MARSTAAGGPFRVPRTGIVSHAAVSISVLHVVDSLNDHAGAPAIALVGLFKALGDHDVASSVITLDRNPQPSGHAAIHGHDPETVRQCVRAADLVHLHGFDRRLGDGVVSEARRVGKPYIIAPLGTFSPNEHVQAGWLTCLAEWVHYRRVLRRASVVIALNEAEARDLRRRSVDGGVRVLPYGLNFDDYADAPDSRSHWDVGDDERIVLFLGPIHPVEGLVPLVRSIGELGHDFRGWKLVLAGPQPGDWRQKMEAAIGRKHARDRVTFVADPDLRAQRALLSRASVLVSASLCVRCPVSVTQAVAAGVPVVATDHGLPPGLTSHIHLCKPTRADLRDALRPLLTCRQDARLSKGSEARQAWARAVDWPALIQSYVELYESAVHP